ncbi:hypothetical protein [Paraburkholderia sp.]|nr:hypothetical protein [Paraburkholderia sp.]
MIASAIIALVFLADKFPFIFADTGFLSRLGKGDGGERKACERP